MPQPPAELAELSRELCTSIVNAIEAEGSVSFERFMRMALYEPGLGYYVNGLHKFGAAGDFTTAPEQTPLFARALARRLDGVGRALGDRWTILELGPGSGVLARDLLVSLDHPPERYRMLEPSAPLRDVQRETLAGLPDDLAERVEWVSAPPAEPFDGAIVANEVIDALPVHRFRVTEDGVAEGRVTVYGDRFDWAWADAGESLADAVERVQRDLPEPLTPGYESEICLRLGEWLRTVTEPLARGLALFVDYGYPRREYYHPDRSGGTLVCHYRHRAHFDPFVWPGLTDLSAFVDFTALAESAQALALDVAGFTTQGGFVLGSGVGEEIERVDDEAERMRMAGAFKRLVLPGEMGERFKVMALTRAFEPALHEFALSDQLGRL